jgi:hypothetical protein
MRSTRIAGTVLQLLIYTALCAGDPQGFVTTGKLLCVLPLSSSKNRSQQAAYALVLEVKGFVYRCTEKKQGLLRRRRFRERDWPLSRPVRVLVDEEYGEIYMRQQREHGKEIVVQCGQRVSIEEWSGCVTEQ